MALRPTLLLFPLSEKNFVCLDVKIMLKFRKTHSNEWLLSFISLNRERACLYNKYFSGVALLHISWIFIKETSSVRYFKQIFRALAGRRTSTVFSVWSTQHSKVPLFFYFCPFWGYSPHPRDEKWPPIQPLIGAWIKGQSANKVE